MISLRSKRFSSYAPAVLRLGLAAVYIWFGTSQIINPDAWTGLVPSWATDVLSASSFTVVQMNGWFEVAAGALLAFGIFVQPVAAILFIHLLIIAFRLGLNPVGIRDFGLSFATLALALFGEDEYCFSSKKQQPPRA